MTLDELVHALPPTGVEAIAFPPALLGAFRRKSITFCTGLTDETTQVYWFQSASFTIDLRLTDGAATPVADRQGWIGDTHWDAQGGELSWTVGYSYQPHNLWPEPARLAFIGNSVIEFAPSGAYVEDWRQLATTGPLLGLRLAGITNAATGQEHAADGGLILAGDHMAFVLSRPVHLQDDAESFETSVAIAGQLVTHSTQNARYGQAIVPDSFELAPDGSVLLTLGAHGTDWHLRFSVDAFVPDFTFSNTSPATPEAHAWLERERAHLARHARRVV